MSVSIYDIAKEANVSPSTVSRALQNHPRIGAETRTRIQTLAKTMGYVPSAVARSLITNKTWTIGMVVTTVADPVVADILDGVEAVAQDAGYSVFLSNSRNDPQREVTVVETFQRRRVDAVIDVASRMGSTYSSKLNQLEVPIVLVEHQEHNDYYHTVSTDNNGGARAAVDHLLALGHRRVGFVGANDRPKSNAERLLGYKLALQQAGISMIPELISHPESNDDFERGQMGLAELLAADP
ncbi:MAG: LacI family DNA-binding transcriptional regulator, partial [Anaerolineae bacterium]|nr:LacI family DNA-binding transcriptional regulator [Anaerolineae bacterium]